jgi:hypothetical protein
VESWDGPTADLVARTYTVPKLTSGQYVQADGLDREPGTYDARGRVELATLAPGEAGLPWGANRWSFTFPGQPFFDAVAAAPEFLDGGDGHGTVVIPEVEGVTYRIDRKPADAGEHAEAGPTEVTATATDGYGLDGVSGWSHTFRGVGSVPVTPEAPTFSDPVGASDDTFTVPTQLGVRYLVDGDVAGSGVHKASEEMVHLTAIATTGFALTGGATTYSHVFERATPPPDPDPEPTPDPQPTPAATVNTARPVLTGTPKLGEILGATSGTWTPTAGVVLAYQWLRGGEAIAGADSATYQPGVADVGQPLSVRVTASRTDAPDLPAVAATSEPTGPVAPGDLVPGTPAVSGLVLQGRTLTAASGTWGPGAVATSITWLRDGTPIPSADGTTYLLTGDDVGARIAVRVTGIRDGYASQSRDSVTTSPVVGQMETTMPTIGGTPRVGRTLVARCAGWAPDGITLSFQWLRGGEAIRGATEYTYTLRPADRGQRIQVRAVGRKPGYLTATRLSARTAPVRR